MSREGPGKWYKVAPERCVSLLNCACTLVRLQLYVETMRGMPIGPVMQISCRHYQECPQLARQCASVQPLRLQAGQWPIQAGWHRLTAPSMAHTVLVQQMHATLSPA